MAQVCLLTSIFLKAQHCAGEARVLLRSPSATTAPVDKSSLCGSFSLFSASQFKRLPPLFLTPCISLACDSPLSSRLHPPFPHTLPLSWCADCLLSQTTIMSLYKVHWGKNGSKCYDGRTQDIFEDAVVESDREHKCRRIH